MKRMQQELDHKTQLKNRLDWGVVHSSLKKNYLSWREECQSTADSQPLTWPLHTDTPKYSS